MFSHSTELSATGGKRSPGLRLIPSTLRTQTKVLQNITEPQKLHRRVCPRTTETSGADGDPFKVMLAAFASAPTTC